MPMNDRGSLRRSPAHDPDFQADIEALDAGLPDQAARYPYVQAVQSVPAEHAADGSTGTARSCLQIVVFLLMSLGAAAAVATFHDRIFQTAAEAVTATPR